MANKAKATSSEVKNKNSIEIRKIKKLEKLIPRKNRNNLLPLDTVLAKSKRDQNSSIEDMWFCDHLCAYLLAPPPPQKNVKKVPGLGNSGQISLRHKSILAMLPLIRYIQHKKGKNTICGRLYTEADANEDFQIFLSIGGFEILQKSVSWKRINFQIPYDLGRRIINIGLTYMTLKRLRQFDAKSLSSLTKSNNITIEYIEKNENIKNKSGFTAKFMKPYLDYFANSFGAVIAMTGFFINNPEATLTCIYNYAINNIENIKSSISYDYHFEEENFLFKEISGEKLSKMFYSDIPPENRIDNKIDISDSDFMEYKSRYKKSNREQKNSVKMKSGRKKPISDKKYIEIKEKYYYFP